MTTDIPLIVDVDAHVVEPPDVWSSRLPAKYRDVGPRIAYLPPGQPKLDLQTGRGSDGCSNVRTYDVLERDGALWLA